MLLLSMDCLLVKFAFRRLYFFRNFTVLARMTVGILPLPFLPSRRRFFARCPNALFPPMVEDEKKTKKNKQMYVNFTNKQCQEVNKTVYDLAMFISKINTNYHQLQRLLVALVPCRKNNTERRNMACTSPTQKRKRKQFREEKLRNTN